MAALLVAGGRAQRARRQERRASSGSWLSADRRRSVLDDLPQSVAEFRGVLMTVHGHGMLRRGLDQLAFTVGGDRDRAVHFAGIVTAVDELASHLSLLRWRQARAVRYAAPPNA